MANIESRAKTVQELSATGASPPENYILKDGIGGADFPVLDIPVLDFGLLTSPTSSQGKKEIQKLRLALEACGYFQAVNHEIEDSFLDEVRGMTREFFSLPMEEKMKCARHKDDAYGYGNDIVYSEKQTLDWNDRLYLQIKPQSNRKLQVWPKNPKNFRKVLLEFSGKLEKMNDVTLRAMAKSLNLNNEECFVKQYGENPTVHSRFNFYPPCPRPDAVLAAKAHGDGSLLTYLLQDKEVEGLQTIKDGQWYRVPILPNAILINAGDQLEIMTNGIFKSPIHRVVTNPHRERFTVATFCAPDATSEVEPVEELIDEKMPRSYKTVVDYSRDLFRSLQTGKRPIDLFKI